MQPILDLKRHRKYVETHFLQNYILLAIFTMVFKPKTKFSMGKIKQLIGNPMYWGLLIMSALCWTMAFIFPEDTAGYVTANLLGVLITGAGIQTVFPGQSACEMYILIGDVDTAFPLQGLSVEIDGRAFISVANSAVLLTAFSKWMQKTINGTAIVGVMLKVATGRINRNTTYRFTNAGATTPNIFVTSDAENGTALEVATALVNVNSNVLFDKFSALFITVPANITQAEIEWNNGCKSTVTFQELDAIFALDNDSEANGELGGVTVIDNRGANSDPSKGLISGYKSVRLYAGATALTVLVAKLPDAAFQALKNS